MKIPTLSSFALWFFFLSFLFPLVDFIRGLPEPSISRESVLILSFAITWALDRDNRDK